MRTVTTGLLVAVSAVVLAGCEKKAEAPAEPAAVASEAPAAAAPTDAAAAATDAAAATPEATGDADPNGNPIRP